MFLATNEIFSNIFPSGDMGSMLAIGIHTQPKNAANETSSLANVYDFAVKKFRVKV